MRPRTFNPLRRTGLPTTKKPRPEVRKESWRSGAVRETQEGIAELRKAAFARSGGFCECWMEKGRENCGKRVFWNSDHLHHLGPRIERSDVLEKVAFVNEDCHAEITGTLKFGKKR